MKKGSIIKMVRKKINGFVIYENIVFIISILIIAFVIFSIIYSFWYDNNHKCIEYKTVKETRCNTYGGRMNCWTEDVDKCVKYED